MQRIVIIALAAMFLAGCTSAPAEPDNDFVADDKPRVPSDRVQNDTSDVAPIELTTAKIDPTFAANATLQGTVNQASTLTVQSGDQVVASLEAEGEWSAPISLAYGHNQFTVTADNGKTTASNEMTVVRLGNVTIDVIYNRPGAKPDTSHVVIFDVDGGASHPQYTEVGATPQVYGTVHDAMASYTEQTGIDVGYDYHESVGGFSVSTIDGEGDPLGEQGGAFWCYSINGQSADGISLQAMVPGDVLEWVLGCTNIAETV